MARKFLYLIAILTVLVIAALFALRIWSKELTEFAFVPREEFVEQAPLEVNAYENPSMWFSRPGMGSALGPGTGQPDPARWMPIAADALPAESAPAGTEPATMQTQAADQPAGAQPVDAAPADAQPVERRFVDSEKTPPFAVFFIHPTSYMERKSWNGPLDDRESQDLARTFVRGMASPFNAATEIWAPRYRQATLGAFLTDAPAAQKAMAAAYRDVNQAFDLFLASIDKKTPIVLAGHSQGGRHLLHLLYDRIAGTPLARRIAGVYIIGWPISVDHDLPALGLPACGKQDQTGCIMSWSSYADPPDPGTMLDIYANSIGLDGQPRGKTPVLCTNPITSEIGGEAPASANLGTMVPNDKLTDGKLVPGMVPAKCDTQGLLLIGEGPEMGPYVLPGNNYHVYDVPLFWLNLREDVNRRVRLWKPVR